MILGIIIGIMILCILWLLYANEIRRKKMDTILKEYINIRDIISDLGKGWEKDIKKIEGEIAYINDNIFVSVESADMMRFEEKVSISHILGELMNDLGYKVSKGTLAVLKIEKSKKR